MRVDEIARIAMNEIKPRGARQGTKDLSIREDSVRSIDGSGGSADGVIDALLRPPPKAYGEADVLRRPPPKAYGELDALLRPPPKAYGEIDTRGRSTRS
jgi:hypothetical protein